MIFVPFDNVYMFNPRLWLARDRFVHLCMLKFSKYIRPTNFGVIILQFTKSIHIQYINKISSKIECMHEIIEICQLLF